MKKFASDLKAGDVINPPSHERRWLWRDGVKRMLTVESVTMGAVDKGGPWMNVKASYGSPYSDAIRADVFRFRPTTMVVCHENVLVGIPAEFGPEDAPVASETFIPEMGS